MKEKLQSLFIFFLLITIFVVDLEVTKLECLFRCGHHPNPVTKIVLFQIFFRQILKVTFREWDRGVDENLEFVTFDGDGCAQISGLSVNLDSFLEKGFLAKMKRMRQNGVQN